MGLLQRAVETYDYASDLIGTYDIGREPLAPICHTIIQASLEITLNSDGKFVSANKVPEDDSATIVPVTIDSASRSSTSAVKFPHPLSDKLSYYIAAPNYLIPLLERWRESEYSHQKLMPIETYLKSGTILHDLGNTGCIKAVQGNIKKETLDSFVRWRVYGCGDEECCWKDKTLFRAFYEFYSSQLHNYVQDVCYISGKNEPVPEKFPFLIGTGKMISFKEDGFIKYTGRISEPAQACTVGYYSYQKANNVLKWLFANQSVGEVIGSRRFLCWNPKGRGKLRPLLRERQLEVENTYLPTDYRQRLANTLLSIKKDMQLQNSDVAVTAIFDMPSKGRISLTYYSESSMDVFLNHIHDWDSVCCWYKRDYGIQAPSIFQIVKCAYGILRDNKIENEKILEVDESVNKLQLQRLLDIRLNGRLMPEDIVMALADRASTPTAFNDQKDNSTWREILYTACAVLQKYRYDKKIGGDEMSWELDKRDRSFQFGRLLAAMDRAECDYLYKIGEKDRQTNAIKCMPQFRRSPWSVFERINRQLNQAYLGRVEHWQKIRYERIKDEICKIIGEFPESDLNKPLEDTYLMGYEIQRNAFFETNDNEEE